MKKKFQLLLSASILILVLSGTVVFTIIVRQFITKQMTKQIVMDNQIIGSEVINYLSFQIDTMNTEEMIKSLQHICDEVMLPNGGFICVMNEDGDLLAAPNIEDMPVKNLMMMSFIDNNTQEEISKEGLAESNLLTGILNFENGARTDIIASLPLSDSGLRLNVHQNMDTALEATLDFIKGFFPLAFIVALGIAIIGFLMVDRIVLRYENQIEKQNVIIEQKNKDLTGSIRYASFLQKSYLPGRNSLSELFPESFIFLKPRDLVSGDFFYVNETKDNKYFSVIDCTGHGVPGSLLSMIGYGLIEQSITTLDKPNTSNILGFLCKKFPEALSQNEAMTDTDGMDMAICSIDKKSRKLGFSGAKNPLLLIRNNEVIKYTGNKHSIGQHVEDTDSCFEQHTIDIQENDMLYLLSDGLQDQFGGPQGKKFMMKKLKELLIKISLDPVDVQHQKIEEELTAWMGELPQVDDITLMGIRVTKDLI